MCVCVCMWMDVRVVQNLVLAEKLSSGSGSSMPLADALDSLPVCCEAGRHTQNHTHMHARTHTQGWSGAGRSPGERSNKLRERVRHAGKERGREEGGSSAESSTFPQSGDLTHGSHTFLSPAAGRAPALRERRERERGTPRQGRLPLWCLQYVHMYPACVCFNMCLPHAPVRQPPNRH